MFAAEAGEKTEQIPLLNDTIRRRICYMLADIQNTVIFLVQLSKMFTIQVDEFFFYFILFFIFISIFILLTRRKATEALYIG